MTWRRSRQVTALLSLFPSLDQIKRRQRALYVNTSMYGREKCWIYSTRYIHLHHAAVSYKQWQQWRKRRESRHCQRVNSSVDIDLTDPLSGHCQFETWTKRKSPESKTRCSPILIESFRKCQFNKGKSTFSKSRLFLLHLNAYVLWVKSAEGISYTYASHLILGTNCLKANWQRKQQSFS